MFNAESRLLVLYQKADAKFALRTLHNSFQTPLFSMSQPTHFTELSAVFGVKDIDNTTLQVCAKLLDLGVDPKKLAQAIRSIQDQAKIE